MYWCFGVGMPGGNRMLLVSHTEVYIFVQVYISHTLSVFKIYIPIYKLKEKWCTGANIAMAEKHVIICVFKNSDELL
jgi:hypothetical protein